MLKHTYFYVNKPITYYNAVTITWFKGKCVPKVWGTLLFLLNLY